MNALDYLIEETPERMVFRVPEELVHANPDSVSVFSDACVGRLAAPNGLNMAMTNTGNGDFVDHMIRITVTVA